MAIELCGLHQPPFEKWLLTCLGRVFGDLVRSTENATVFFEIAESFPGDVRMCIFQMAHYMWYGD